MSFPPTFEIHEYFSSDRATLRFFDKYEKYVLGMLEAIRAMVVKTEKARALNEDKNRLRAAYVSLYHYAYEDPSEALRRYAYGEEAAS